MCKQSSTAGKSFCLSITPLTSINPGQPMDTKLKQMAAVTVSAADQFLAYSERAMALIEPAQEETADRSWVSKASLVAPSGFLSWSRYRR